MNKPVEYKAMTVDADSDNQTNKMFEEMVADGWTLHTAMAFEGKWSHATGLHGEVPRITYVFERWPKPTPARQTPPTQIHMPRCDGSPK